MSNPSLQLLAHITGTPVAEVEKLWRQARRHNRAEGAPDYRQAWAYLGGLLSLPAATRPTAMGSCVDVVACGPISSLVRYAESLSPVTFTIPSCLLILDQDKSPS